MKFVPSSQPPNSHFLSDVIISICSSHKTKPLPLWILLLSRLHWQPQVTLAWLPRSCACVCWIFLLRVGKESLVINWVCQCCLVCFVSSVSLKADLTVVVVLCVCVCVFCLEPATTGDVIALNNNSCFPLHSSSPWRPNCHRHSWQFPVELDLHFIENAALECLSTRQPKW